MLHFYTDIGGVRVYKGKPSLVEQHSRMRPFFLRRPLFECLTFFLLLTMPFFSLALPPSPAVADEMETRGKASWYGTTAHGKQTASGERFDRDSLTAAHRTLAFGTVLRVFNLRNHRQVLVRVNDRGPFSQKRIVDVSRRAAEQLRMERMGVISVVFEAISNARGELLNRDNSFYVHIADEKTIERANALSAQLKQRLNQPVRTLFSLQEAHPAYAVCLGPYARFTQAELVFIEAEKKKFASHGLIEAPTLGGDIPRHVPPLAHPKKVLPVKKSHQRVVK